MIHLDFETRSAVDIREQGAHVYARHPSTEVLCAAWSIDDGPICLWYPPKFDIDCDPLDGTDGIILAVQRGGTVAAYNAEFERLIWNHVLARSVDRGRGKMPLLKYEQMYCVAINAYSMTYGRKMEDTAIQVGAIEQKDSKGKDLINRYSKPWKYDDHGNPIFREDIKGIKELGEYCRQDVRTERAILAELEPLSADELALYHVDQRINDRGFPVDLDLARACVDVAERAQLRAGERLSELTLGVVTAPSQRERILDWAKELGYPKKSLGKDIIAGYLASDEAEHAPAELIEMLEIRRDFGQTGHSKFQAAIDRSWQGRVRGSLLMNGARTLRWTGAGVQPQNMKRGLDKPEKQRQVIETITTRDLGLIEMVHGDIIGVLGDVARGVVRAEPGYELHVADYSQIEARVLAVIADDQPNLEAFHEKRCIYRQMGSVIFGKPYDEILKGSEERHVGKQAELAFGYGMGEKTFQGRQKLYGQDFPLSFCKEVKDKYRSLHSAIVRFWRRIELDALKCITSHKRVERKWYAFDMRPKGMVMIGPSGAQQWYIDPKIQMVDRWGNGELQPVITYMGLAGYQWQRLETYGGKLTENLVQFVSRCIQADAVKAAEAAGFDVILHTHDEIVAHNRKGEKTFVELESIMETASTSTWAHGWPIEASGGWTGERYRK